MIEEDKEFVIFNLNFLN